MYPFGRIRDRNSKLVSKTQKACATNDSKFSAAGRPCQLPLLGDQLLVPNALFESHTGRLRFTLVCNVRYFLSQVYWRISHGEIQRGQKMELN